MIPVLTLFTVIFLEGYIVLSTELLAIRLLLPFTGSGTDTVSIIIAAVLLPLAFGYYAGGRHKMREGGKAFSVRKKLVRNLVISAAILTFGLSYFFLEWGFTSLQSATGLQNRILLTAIYSVVFIVYPVFLLGQTVPLISNYFSRERLSEIAGRILFFSTLGSFMGAVFGTLVLMARLGVHHTVSITLAAMTLLVLILAKRKISLPVFASFLCLAAALGLNSGYAMKLKHIVSNNLYNTVQVVDYNEEGMRALMLNRSFASAVFKYSPETYMDYMIFMEVNFITPLQEQAEKRDILALGAGGFTLGRTDEKNNYTYVDIDENLKAVAEQDYLKEPLSPNKKFVGMDARAYLRQTDATYDLIVMDLFRDALSVPESLSTREFYEEVKRHLKPGGVVVGNFTASANFSDAYSRNLDATLRAVFPALNRQIIKNFDAWKRENDWNNIIYSYVHHDAGDAVVYTDDKNTIVYDKPAIMPH